MYAFFLDFLSFFIIGENSRRDTFGYNIARFFVSFSLTIFLFIHAQIEKDFISLIGSFVVGGAAFIGVTEETARSRKLPFFGFCFFLRSLFLLVSASEVESLSAPDAINSFNRPTFFHESLLSKDEILEYWSDKDLNRVQRNQLQEIDESFLSANKALREFLLFNSSFCVVAAPETEVAFGATVDLSKLLWTVPQAWYHERKFSCRIGLVAGHGDGEMMDVTLSENLREKTIVIKDLKKAYNQIDLVIMSCRGRKDQLKDDEIFLDDEMFKSAEAGFSTDKRWFENVVKNGLLQKLIDHY
jgi:hypothetical protein